MKCLILVVLLASLGLTWASLKQIKNEYTGKEYFYDDEGQLMVWQEAKSFCQKLGYSMVRIDGSEELSFILRKINPKNDFWIAMAPVLGTPNMYPYRWDDNHDMVKYVNWGLMSKMNLSTDCTVTGCDSDGLYFAQTCTFRSQVICTKPSSGSETPVQPPTRPDETNANQARIAALQKDLSDERDRVKELAKELEECKKEKGTRTGGSSEELIRLRVEKESITSERDFYRTQMVDLQRKLAICEVKLSGN